MKGSYGIRKLFFIGIIFSLLATGNVNAYTQAKAINIGRVIATGKDFVVHTPMYELDGNKPVCPTQFRASSSLSQEESQRIQRDYLDYIKSKQKPIYDAYNRKIKALEKPYEARILNISARDRVEWNKKWSKIEQERQAEIEKLYQWQKREYARIEAEAKAIRNKALKGKAKEEYFYLYVIHSPEDPEQTIVPLSGRHVTQDYLREFNRVVSPFLNTCGAELNTVLVVHYYRDQYNTADNSVPDRQHIVWFNYRFHEGRLVVKEDKYPTPMYYYDPKQNRRLTLAGFRANETHKRRMAATYRSNFLYAEGRKPGIVYKLDPFWRQFDQFEIARRIFDGDFVEFNKTIEFKAMYMALADVYSKRCEDSVAQFTAYKIPYKAYAGSELNLDGSQTIHEVEGVKTVRIDSRFAKNWLNYKPAVTAYWAKKLISNLGSAKDLMRMPAGRAKQMMSNITGNMLVEHYQMDKFIKEQGCDSVTVQQMVDNFLRAGNAMNSVQRDGIRYDGAEHESDPVKKKGDSPLLDNPLYQSGGRSPDQHEIPSAGTNIGERGLPTNRTSTPPASTSNSVNTQYRNTDTKAALPALGGNGLLGDQAKRNIDQEQSYRRKLNKRLIELITERNQTPKHTKRYKDLQDSIVFLMGYLGVSREPSVTADTSASEGNARSNTQTGKTPQQEDVPARKTRARYTQRDVQKQPDQKRQRSVQEIRRRQQLEQHELRERKRRIQEEKNKKMLEKYARMNDEVKRLEKKYAEEYKKAVDVYNRNMANAKTAEDRLKAAQEYKKIRLKQAENQRKETQKLMEKYR